MYFVFWLMHQRSANAKWCQRDVAHLIGECACSDDIHADKRFTNAFTRNAFDALANTN